MAAARQPAVLRDLLIWFAGVVAKHGFAVNLVVVVILAAAGAGLLSARAAIARPVGGGLFVFCLATWVLVQDCGVFGGTGTDPNSMLPQVLVIAAGLLAAAPGVRLADATCPALPDPGTEPKPPPGRPRTMLWPWQAARRVGRAFGTASASAVLAVWAVAMVLMGVVPMAIAAIART